MMLQARIRATPYTVLVTSNHFAECAAQQKRTGDRALEVSLHLCGFESPNHRLLQSPEHCARLLVFPFAREVPSEGALLLGVDQELHPATQEGHAAGLAGQHSVHAPLCDGCSGGDVALPLQPAQPRKTEVVLSQRAPQLGSIVDAPRSLLEPALQRLFASTAVKRALGGSGFHAPLRPSGGVLHPGLPALF